MTESIGTTDIGSLPTLAEFGFYGGRDCLATFATRAFAAGAPRFLRTDAGELAVFRNHDLKRLSAIPQIGAVPPAVLFGPAFGAPTDGSGPPGAALAAVIANQVFTANPPIHKPVRKALVAQLGPKQTAAMEPLAGDVVRDILDALHIGNTVDAVADIAERLTCSFWGRILDMTGDEVDAMLGHVRDLTPMFSLDPGVESIHAFDRGASGYHGLIETAAARSLARRDNAFLGALAVDLEQIDLPDDPTGAGIVPRTIGALLAGNLIDGFHTAALAAANTLYALAIRPDLLERIASAPELLSNAIFEALRVEPPVLMLNRWMLEDVDLDGLKLRKGTVIAFLWGAGGYDPDVYPEPDRFDLHRSRQGSTTFGGGLHLCPGRHVAVMLVRVLVTEVLARGWRFRAAAAPEWIACHVMGQMRRFAMIVEVRTKGGPS